MVLPRIIVSIGCILAVNVTFAQDWKQMMSDPNVNFYDVVQEAEAYFDTIDIHAKGSGWKGFQRWVYENEYKYYPSGDRSQVDPYFVAHAFDNFLENSPASAKTIFDNGWEQLGPHEIDVVTGHYSLGLGRVETYYADPNDPQRIYLGSRSGGFWKTVDGGQNWSENSTDFLPATGVNTIAVSPTNSDSILINVRNAQNGTTHGIYRSADAGDTWSITAFNPTNLGWGGLGTNRKIYQIAYHPTVPGLVFVTSNEGLFRSTDNLATWTEVITNSVSEVVFHRTDPNIIYLRRQNNVVHRSTDMGLTFTASNPIPGISGYYKMATSEDCLNCLYVGNGSGIWRSDDSGQNFNLVNNSVPGFYGAFAVNDLDTNFMLMGGIDVYASSSAGQSFSQKSWWWEGNASYENNASYVHADIRGASCVNGTFWINTDGFLARSSNNGNSWERFEGMSIRENYSLGVSQSNHGRTICGSQDNGTSIKTENSWIEFYGADGMEGIIHPLNYDWMIGSLQNGGRRRTKDGGYSQQGVVPPGQSGSWVAPLAYDPNNQMRVYSFGSQVHRSDNFGSSWTDLGSPSFSGSITSAAIAENSSNRLVVTRSSNIELSEDGGMTFTGIKNNLPNLGITDVCFDPNDDSTLIVVYSNYQNNGNKVFITTNSGASWQNITYNLGNIPVRSVVIDHTDASTIYVGTEIGVYKKAMASNVWSLYNVDLPNVSVRELEVVYGSNTLRAVTWGRGLWEYTLDGRQDFPAIVTTEITDMPTDIVPKETVAQYVTSTISYDNAINSAYVEWSLGTPTFGNVIPMTNTAGDTWVADAPLPSGPVGSKVYFKVFAVGANGDTTETYKFMYEIRPFEYCNATGNMTTQTAITKVTYNTIDNASGKTAPYTDYSTTETTTLEKTMAYDLTVQVNTDGNFTAYSKAWIDWNRDGDFEDSGEEYDLGSASNVSDDPTSLSPLSITVPATALIGTTKMRVSVQRGTEPAACNEDFDGEVEEYEIVVIPLCVPQVSQTSVTTCDQYDWNGVTYTASGMYSAQLVNQYGCDSTANLNLTIANNSGVDVVTSCDSYTWIDGNTYTASNNAATHVLSNVAGCDSTVTLNLTINQSTSGVDVQETCHSLTWIDGITYTSSNNSATFTLANSAGCDSVVTLNLTIDPINTSVTQNGIVLTADNASQSYQWIDCNDNNAPISGATNQAFIPSENGDYAVVITSGGCSDTSSCISVTTVGLEEFANQGFVVLAPNPTDGSFSVTLNEMVPRVQSTIYDAAGKLVQSVSYTDVKDIDYALDVANGTYYLHLNWETGGGVYTLIVER